MMEKMKRILIIFLLLTTLLGCYSRLDTVPNNMEEQFLTAVSVSNMNESLQLKAEGDQESFHLGSKIPLLIYNESPYSIFFVGDAYLKLFIIKDGKWAEVKNELTYSGSQVLSPKGTLLLDQSNTWAKPALTEDEVNSDQKDLPLRIVIIGEIIENDIRTGKLVGAYVDVFITH
jgi:hypothetical protein